MERESLSDSDFLKREIEKCEWSIKYHEEQSEENKRKLLIFKEAQKQGV